MPIATAHFFAHVTHTSCMAGHEGKQTWQPMKHQRNMPAKSVNVQTFSTRIERENVWHHGIAIHQGLLGNVAQ